MKSYQSYQTPDTEPLHPYDPGYNPHTAPSTKPEKDRKPVKPSPEIYPPSPAPGFAPGRVVFSTNGNNNNRY